MKRTLCFYIITPWKLVLIPARKFLEKGDRVKVTLRFRGREMAHMTQSKYILDDFAKALGISGNPEKAIKHLVIASIPKSLEILYE